MTKITKSAAMNKPLTASDFRNNIKEYLDQAVQGAPVLFYRGGIQFTVTANVTHPTVPLRGSDEQSMQALYARLGQQQAADKGKQL